MAEDRVLERAFEMARSGRFSSVSDLRKELQKEGFTYIQISADLNGRAIQRQLRQAIVAATA
jgi:hypothetical protein